MVHLLAIQGKLRAWADALAEGVPTEGIPQYRDQLLRILQQAHGVLSPEEYTVLRESLRSDLAGTELFPSAEALAAMEGPLSADTVDRLRRLVERASSLRRFVLDIQGPDGNDGLEGEHYQAAVEELMGKIRISLPDDEEEAQLLRALAPLARPA